MWYVERWKFLKCTSQKKLYFAECLLLTLGKELTVAGWFNGGPKFAECETLTLGKESLCRVACLSTRQRGRLCRVPILSTRQRPALPRVVSLSSVRVWALDKDSLCRVPEIKNSAKFLALGKACDSGSGSWSTDCCTFWGSGNQISQVTKWIKELKPFFGSSYPLESSTPHQLVRDESLRGQNCLGDHILENEKHRIVSSDTRN